MPASLSAVGGRAPALLRSVRPACRALGARQLTSARTLGAASRLQTAQTQQQPQLSLSQKRAISYSAVRSAVNAAIQNAPDPKAYLQSGVVKQKTDVKVKKVLVIGSGGLAIGQAGEFDYSGELGWSPPMRVGEEEGRRR
jgi:carbamoyl-phosphate synthase large subunit